MRRTVEGLGSPYPLATLLPAVLQEDQFVVRLTAAFDDLLAPAISVLDCLDAYVDPLLAPSDFVDWLADWVGAPLDDHWDDRRRRESVLAAARVHRMRGTAEGLRTIVELSTGGDVEVVDSTSTRWSVSPTADEPASQPGLVVRVAVDDPDSVRLYALEEMVAAAKPAHLPHTIEVVKR